MIVRDNIGYAHHEAVDKVCVFADSSLNAPVAIVVPSKQLRESGKSKVSCFVV